MTPSGLNEPRAKYGIRFVEEQEIDDKRKAVTINQDVSFEVAREEYFGCDPTDWIRCEALRKRYERLR